MVTLAQFDDKYEMVYQNRAIDDVLDWPSTRGALPHCWMPSADSSRRSAVVSRALPEAERPGSVTIVVLTDGHENASKEWTKDTIQQLISDQGEKYGWDFVFLGANMDAVDVGQQIGFAPDRAMTYAPSSAGVSGTFSSMTDWMGRKRSSPKGSRIGFTESERKRSKGE